MQTGDYRIVLFSILLFISLQLVNFSAKCQKGRNEFNLCYGLMYYPDWKFNSKSLGFNYSYDINQKLCILVNVFHTEQDLFYPER